jgi:hypothetical protein
MTAPARTRRTPPTPQDGEADRPRPTFDPALSGLVWALAIGPGRIPFLP